MTNRTRRSTCDEPLLTSSTKSLLPSFYNSTSHNEKYSSVQIVRAPKYTDIQNNKPSSSASPMTEESGSVSPAPNSIQSSHSYDVVSNGSSEQLGQTSWILAAFLLINAALGAGLLNYPVAYDRLGGISYATMIQFVAVILMATTMMTLVYCAQLCNENSYHGVMNAMCGKVVMNLSAMSISITCFGICVTFVIIIGDQFDRIFATYIGPHFCLDWFLNRYFTMCVTGIVTIWPMCYFRRLDFLRHINVLGVIASFYIIFLNVYSYYSMSDAKNPPPMRTSPKSIVEFTAALPVVFFAFQTHEIVIPVYDSMSDKSAWTFCKSMILSLLSLLLLYCIAGTYGYLTFGSKVASDIMLMYDATDPIVLAGIIALIVKIITTYPPVVFCGRDTIVRLILSRIAKKRFSEYDCLDSPPRRTCPPSTERKVNVLTTTIWNIMVLILAIIIPNITVAIGFLGSLASCNVFIFPGMALIALTKRYSKLNKVEPSCRFQTKTRTVSNGRLPKKYLLLDGNDGDDEDGNGEIEMNKKDFRVKSSNSFFSLTRPWVQKLFLCYSAFIIIMGVVMFVIILIQVYHDFQNQDQHGAMCDPTQPIPNYSNYTNKSYSNNTTSTTQTTNHTTSLS